MTAREGRFPLFDSLRAIAALGVVTTHAAFYAGALGDGSVVRPYAARLDVGVTVFFLISGFLLYRPFAAAHIRGEPAPSGGPYAWRRFLRIAPAYWAALTITAIWFSRHEVFHGSGIPTYYGLAQAYRGENWVLGGVSQAWTLTIEVAFYAFLPLWAWLIRSLPGRERLRVELIGLGALAAFSLGWTLVVLGAGSHDVVDFSRPAVLALPAFLDQFALGMFLAVASVWLEDGRDAPRAVRVLDRFPGLAWALGLVAFWVVSTRIGLTGRFGENATEAQYVGRHLLYAAVAFCVIAPAVFGDQRRGMVRRFLGNPALLYLGLISYGIYLWHQAVYRQLYDWDFHSITVIHSYVQWLVAGAGGAILIATVSYYVLERPALSLKRLFPDRRARRPDADQPGAVGAPATP